MIRDFYPRKTFFLTSSCLVIVGAIFGMLNLNDISKFSLFHILPAFAYSGVLLTALPIWFNYKKSLTILSVVLYLTILLALFLGVFSLNLGYFILGIYWLIWLFL